MTDAVNTFTSSFTTKRVPSLREVWFRGRIGLIYMLGLLISMIVGFLSSFYSSLS